MSFNKKLMQRIAVTVSTFTLLSGTVVAASEVLSTPTDGTVAGGKATAGIVASLERTAAASIEKGQLQSAAIAEQSKTEALDKKTNAEDKTIDTAASEKESDTEEIKESAQSEAEVSAEEASDLSEAEQKWQKKAMADVDSALCIRAEGKKDAQIVGMMYPTSVATVIKQGKNWTKIKSGNVEGYVSSDYLVFGSDAYEHAQEVCEAYAHVQTNGLRIRQKAHENATILTLADEGTKLVLDTDAKETDGWVAVSTGNGDGYVSEDYVTVKLGTTKALSIEEIEEQRAKEAAKAAAEKAAQEAKEKQAAAVSAAQTQTVSASSSDVTLLAAIIQCEAGGESYRGQVAVGSVVMNRVRSSSFPNTISGVIYQGGQFSPVANGALSRVLASGNIYSSCIQAAKDALAGADTTGGKLYFRRVNGRSGLVIGNHVFY